MGYIKEEIEHEYLNAKISVEEKLSKVIQSLN